MTTGFNTLADLQRETNERIEDTNERLGLTNERLDGAIVRLDRHEVVLVRLVDAVSDLRGDVRGLRGDVRGLGERFDNFLTGTHRQEHNKLIGRVGRIEGHLGLEPI
jgi:hypothetical protein